jgi:hypothetical protein
MLKNCDFILKNCKGSFLLDVMIGLSLITSVIAISTPLIYSVYQERMTITQQRYAAELLHNSLQRWIAGELENMNNKVESTEGQYRLNWTSSNSSVTLCVSWIGSNSRDYITCGAAKQ